MSERQQIDMLHVVRRAGDKGETYLKGIGKADFRELSQHEWDSFLMIVAGAAVKGTVDAFVLAYETLEPAAAPEGPLKLSEAPF